MLIDTSAWVEYFKGTQKGLKVKEHLKTEKEIFTNPLTIAELSQWADKNQLDVKSILTFVYDNSEILELSRDLFEWAGKRYNILRSSKQKISMIDVIIYVSALTYGFSVLTTDTDFAGLPFVEML